ncbi:hypothetical protein [Effusibacillus lacus]|uniref:Uncharacterized protein n=1 Tax=Effusibacillus lacus TaxID=1348429 RepID=A0A292YI64_9BACL|nr:hypothetical protein [Effusibacillus lacus]TCS74319.1 hypothetical protein EDD64_11459 [Effusibacillus lacus]GAX88776.1 hypothetical protein EFBL_0390 [Effusibacillus lacus]
MWVFTYQGVGGYTESEGVRVDDGQLFFQDETASPAVFYTYDRVYGQGWVPIRSVAMQNSTFGIIYVNGDDGLRHTEALYRLDTYNCSVDSNYCFSLGGSFYDLRQNMSVYSSTGFLYDTIDYITHQAIFANNYGYTKVTTPSGLNCGGTGIRIWGKRRKSDGQLIQYVGEYFASELVCNAPNNYIINTK